MQTKKGVDQILLFRELDDKNAAWKLWFQTEHSLEGSLEGGDSTETKDGIVNTPGTVTEELPFDGLIAREDPCFSMLKKAWRERKKIEVWVIDKGATPETTGSEPDVTTKYPAEYAQGTISEWSETAAADGNMELSASIAIDGIPQEGMATLTAAQAAIVQYEFRDTTATI